MKLAPGLAFQPRGDGYHLKVVVTWPNALGRVVLFSLTDVRHVAEKICVFDVGDHPFFDKPTAVNFRRSSIMKGEISAQGEDLIKIHPRVSLPMLRKMLEVAHTSEDIEPRPLEMLPAVGAPMDAFIARLASEYRGF